MTAKRHERDTEIEELMRRIAELEAICERLAVWTKVRDSEPLFNIIKDAMRLIGEDF